MKVEFHQSQIVVDARLVNDDGKVVGKPRFAFEVLLNNDAEWGAVQQQVQDGLKQLQQQADANSPPEVTKEEEKE